MRKLISTFIIAMFAFSYSGFASNTDLFEVDRQSLQTEFADLNEIEAYVLANQGVSVDEMQNNPLIGSMDLNILRTSSPMGAMFTIDDMEWGAFAWGLICCPIGFFVVGINGDSSQEEKTSYWIGVIVFALLGGFGGGIYAI